MIRIQPRSVRVRLTLWYVGVMLLVLGVYAGAVYTVVRDNSSQRLDDHLKDDFDWAYDMLALRPDGSIAPYDETGAGDSPWLRVYSPDGQFLWDTPEARRNPVPASAQLARTPDERIVTVANEKPPFVPYRVMSGGAKIGSRPVVVQVARSEASIIQDQNQLLYMLLLGLPVAIALAGIGLHQITGVAAWDAIGSILVGALLAVVAVVLIDRNRRFLTGEPPTSQLYAAAKAQLAALPEVDKVRFLRLEFIGPKQLFLVGSVDLVGDDTESHIAHRLRRLERELETNPLIADALLTVSDPDFEDDRADDAGEGRAR